VKKLLFPALLGLLSLAVIFGTAIVLRMPLSWSESIDAVPLAVLTFTTYRTVASGIVVFFSLLTSIHAVAPNRWRALYMAQLVLGFVMLLILCGFAFVTRQWAEEHPVPVVHVDQPL
jgi:hypothetical protein